MSRKIGIIAALCCALVLCFALAGCGGVDKSKYTGDWQLAYGSDENLDESSIQLLESLGATVKMTLNEDGTGSLDLFGQATELKWEATSNTEGKMTLDGAEAKLELQDEQLTIVDNTGASMTFKRPS